MVINLLVVLVTWIYPSPSISPVKKATNEEGIDKYFYLSNLLIFLLFNACTLIVPIVGKIHIVDKVMKVSVMLFDSTISCPTHGIALIRLVITVAPHKDIWPNGNTYKHIYSS